MRLRRRAMSAGLFAARAGLFAPKGLSGADAFARFVEADSPRLIAATQKIGKLE